MELPNALRLNFPDAAVPASAEVEGCTLGTRNLLPERRRNEGKKQNCAQLRRGNPEKFELWSRRLALRCRAVAGQRRGAAVSVHDTHDNPDSQTIENVGDEL